MRRNIVKTLLLAHLITAAAALAAIFVNGLRPDGIDLVAQAPYEIFSECKDSMATSKTVAPADIRQGVVPIYVDARPADAFGKEHVRGAVHIPYSALFGASEADVQKLKTIQANAPLKSIVVYGLFTDEKLGTIDFAEPLAAQLVEMGLKNVSHVAGGIDALKNQGIETVKGQDR